MKNKELESALITIKNYCESIPLCDCEDGKCELYIFCREEIHDGVTPFMELIHNKLSIK